MIENSFSNLMDDIVTAVLDIFEDVGAWIGDADSTFAPMNYSPLMIKKGDFLRWLNVMLLNARLRMESLILALKSKWLAVIPKSSSLIELNNSLLNFKKGVI